MWSWDCEGVSEVVNDLDGRVSNFYSVLRSPGQFVCLQTLAALTPFSEGSFEQASEYLSEHRAPFLEPVTAAWHFLVLVRMSRAGGGRSFTPLSRTRLRRGMNEQVSSYLSAVDGLQAAHERLRRVAVYNRPALEVMAKEDGTNTLFYVDCPYLHETRESEGLYEHEMSRADHEELLDFLTSCKSHVMVSGYPSELYDRRLAGWKRHALDRANSLAGGDSKRRMQEVVWAKWN